VLRDLAEPETRPWRLGSTLFVIFGAAALFVATSGVYALLNVIVTQRSREIGVRLALGASPGRTLLMIVRQSLGWVAVGLLAGLAATLATGRFIQPLLFETSPYDGIVFASTAALLLVVALAASLAPAVRASRVDPNVALRVE
jgi:putative ABC transport system permease protein